MNKQLSDLAGLRDALEKLMRHLSSIGKSRHNSLVSLEWKVFTTLRLDKVSMKELSEQFQKNRSTMTGIIDRLKKKGVVTRETDPLDRRVVLVSLTKTWRRKYNEAVRGQERYAQTIYEAITGERVDSLLKLLQETNNCVDKRFALVEKTDK